MLNYNRLSTTYTNNQRDSLAINLIIHKKKDRLKNL